MCFDDFAHSMFQPSRLFSMRVILGAYDCCVSRTMTVKPRWGCTSVANSLNRFTRKEYTRNYFDHIQRKIFIKKIFFGYNLKNSLDIFFQRFGLIPAGKD